MSEHRPAYQALLIDCIRHHANKRDQADNPRDQAWHADCLHAHQQELIRLHRTKETTQ